MKKLSTLITIVLFALNSYCQTNTFPANGNVGIGTSANELSKLTIVGPSTSYPNHKALYIKSEGASPSFHDQVMIYSDLSSGYGIAFAGQGHHRSGIYAENFGGSNSQVGQLTLWARSGGNIILDAGKIGIGTNKPVSRLEVNGDISLARTHKIKFLEVVGGGDRAYIRSTNGTNGEDYNSLIFAVNAGNESMIIKSDGNVGIGTSTTGTHKLAVNGTIGAREIKVEATGWSDFVFEDDYQLKKLEEVESYITKNNHLPDVPSEKKKFWKMVYNWAKWMPNYCRKLKN